MEIDVIHEFASSERPADDELGAADARVKYFNIHVNEIAE